MSEGDFQVLLKKAKQVHMTPAEVEEQRRSFAYGNANIENPAVTRAVVDAAADELARKPHEDTKQAT